MYKIKGKFYGSNVDAGEFPFEETTVAPGASAELGNAVVFKEVELVPGTPSNNEDLYKG